MRGRSIHLFHCINELKGSSFIQSGRVRIRTVDSDQCSATCCLDCASQLFSESDSSTTLNVSFLNLLRELFEAYHEDRRLEFTES